MAEITPLPCVSQDERARELAAEAAGLARRLVAALDGSGCTQFDLGNIGQDLCDACNDLARYLQSLADPRVLAAHLEARLSPDANRRLPQGG